MSTPMTFTFDGYRKLGQHNFSGVVNSIFKPKQNHKTSCMDVEIGGQHAYCDIKPVLYSKFICAMIRASITYRNMPYTLNLRLVRNSDIPHRARYHKVRHSSLLAVVQSIVATVANRCPYEEQLVSNIRVAFVWMDKGLEVSFRATFTREHIEERVRRAVAARDNVVCMVDISTQVCDLDFDDDICCTTYGYPDPEVFQVEEVMLANCSFSHRSIL